MAKVLVVDDNPANRELTVVLLRYHGHEPREAADGAQALEIVRREGADLILSDILMPTMDGYELVQALRADPTLAGTRVIFCTAVYREQQAQQLALACGVSDILVKPFDADRLLEAIDRALNQGAQPAVDVTGDFTREHRRLLSDKVGEQTEALQTALGRLEALHELNLRLSTEHDMGLLLGDVCRGARELLAARYAVIVVRDKFDPQSRSFSHSGIAAETAAALPCPSLEFGVCAAVMDERRARRAANPGGDPTLLGLPAEFPPVHAALIAPVISLTHGYGFLCLTDKIGPVEFSAADERVLAILAAQVGRIYENGSLYQEVQRHAQALEVQITERNRAMEEQRASELRFRQLAENIQDAFWICTPDYRKVLYLSPAFEQIWGRRIDANGTFAWAPAVHPEDRAAVSGELMRRGVDGAEFNLEYRIVRPDGGVRWISDRAFPIRDADGHIYRVAGVARDITDRKEHEETIRRLTRLYAVLSGVNAMIIRIRDRDALFQEVCRVAVIEGEFSLVWIGTVDPDTLEGRVAAWHAPSGELLPGLQLVARDGEPGSERPGSVAVRTRAPVVVNDVALSLQPIGLRQQVLAQGHLALAAIPIVTERGAVAVMGFCARRRDFFDAGVVALLNNLAGDLAYALDHIAKEEKLAYLAVYDVLTGLPNNTLYLDRLGQLLRSASTSGHAVAALVLDLDRFKQINDTLGRPVGDALLRRVADRLSATFTGAACASRVSADTFAVAVGGLQHGEDVAARLLDELERVLRDPIVIDEHTIAVSFHTGIAIAPTDGKEAATLFKNAEAALRRAQASNEPFLFYSAAVNATVLERVSMEARLRRAMERQEFELHYQPKVDTGTHRIVGVEALLRWNDPDSGIVMPARFIPVLEETGMILHAGRTVIEMALQAHRRWTERALPAPRIAVNVSALQLRQRGFADTIARLIAEYRVPAGSLELEITESMLMDDLEGSIRTLRQISDTGVHLAMDDFGTGYSSLRYLAKLPIGTVKIDRSFIASMIEDPDSMTIVSMIISLAHSLDLAVCAEGVETADQSQSLRLLQCDALQGYLHGRPMPEPELLERFKVEAVV